MPKEPVIICIGCPLGCRVTLTLNDQGEILDVSDNQCNDGKKYAISEFKSPKRILTATVITEGSPRMLLPVRTRQPIPKDRLRDCMSVLSRVKVRPPIRMGEVIVSNILNTGADIVSSDSL
jgi:CxxC motif-containing protein